MTRNHKAYHVGTHEAPRAPDLSSGTDVLRAPRYGQSQRRFPDHLLGLVAAAVLYNAGLAALNAVGVHQTFATVALTEALILASTAAYIGAAKLPVINPLNVRIVLFGIVVAIYVSFASQAAAFDCGRSAAIIGLFAILGATATERQVFLLFRLLSAAVLVFLLVEIFDTALYVKIFQPADYYAATRGIEEFSLDDSGLFRNALGFQGRFSFGLSDHRTASIFIEQVSLANFCGVLIIYLLACYDRLTRPDRLLHVGTVVLVLLSNDTRTTSSFALISLAGAYLFPRLPARATFLAMPAVLGFGFAFIFARGLSASDDLQGRLSVTVMNLSSLDWSAWLGFGARRLSSYMDSGYPYVIAGSTVFGLVFLWALLATALPADTAPRRRCLFGLNIYMCFNLMIGGTAVFSIKIAAPLWMLVGYMSVRPLWDARQAGERAAARMVPNGLASST